MVDPTQMGPSSTSPLVLFQGIICNTERLKRGDLGALNYWGDLILEEGESDLKGGNLRPHFIACLLTSESFHGIWNFDMAT